MDEIQSDEELRLWVINHLATKLAGHAILKGGMVLRLLHCPRYTNDIDYVMVPFTSKKEIVSLIQKAFRDIAELEISHTLHSTNACFFIACRNRYGFFQTQIEANVAQSCEQESISTGDIAIQYHQQPQVISVMRFDVALAHKLAAWNERELVRDLYDIYFIHKNLDVLPNFDVLKERLLNIHYAKKVRGKAMPKRMTLEQFWEKLWHHTATLTQKEIENELRDYFEPDHLVGLDKKMKVALHQMGDKVLLEMESRGRLSSSR